jgi:hypothetical protein
MLYTLKEIDCVTNRVSCRLDHHDDVELFCVYTCTSPRVQMYVGHVILTVTVTVDTPPEDDANFQTKISFTMTVTVTPFLKYICVTVPVTGVFILATYPKGK